MFKPILWDLWLTKWHWDRLHSEHCALPLSVSLSSYLTASPDDVSRSHLCVVYVCDKDLEGPVEGVVR